MKRTLAVIFSVIILSMLVVTGIATLDRGVFEALRQLWPDPWFKATLADAYFGFLTFFLWVAYKETRTSARVQWLVTILALGNIAMAGYVLLQLRKLPPGATVRDLLVQQN